MSIVSVQGSDVYVHDKSMADKAWLGIIRCMGMALVLVMSSL